MSQILSQVLHEQSEHSDDRDGSIVSWWQVEQLSARSSRESKPGEGSDGSANQILLQH